MKKISVILLSILLCGAASAIPAKRGTFKYTQPDGTVITIQKHGDEFFHWTTDASGKVVEMDENGFYRPADTSKMSARRNAARARRAARNTARKASGHIAVGQKHFLVILVEFSDKSFASQTANQDFHNMLNQQGYSVNGGTGSARDFYYDNSHGYFEPLFDVYGPIKLENTMSYYGKNDSQGNDMHPEEAVAQGCTGLADQIDFSLYDNDNDGDVDLVFMYYAGQGEADGGSDDTIWPHQWELSSAGINLTLGGKKIDSYACSNEIDGTSNNMCAIGTACHEFGHAMGLPDFYDTDYDNNGQAAAMFDFSTMDSGAYNNDGHTPPYFTVEERILLGWITEDAFKEFTTSGNIVLGTVDDNIAYKTYTDQDGEYFVYECRGSNGWDYGLSANGLIVTHIDKSSRSVNYGSGSTSAYNLWAKWQQTNAINENGKHPCCYVIPAADQSNLMYGYKYDSGYGYYFDWSKAGYIPFPGTSKVTSYTAKSWNGVDSEITLSNIKYANDQVSFTVTVPSEELAYNVIANPGNGVYNAGDIFTLAIEESEARAVVSTAWYYDDEPVTGESVVLTAGQHVIEAVLTFALGGTQTVTLEITVQ